MKLFWVTTPCHYEDWFAVAENKKQAEQFHEFAEGFNPGYAKAKFICDISKDLVRRYNLVESNWPNHKLLTELGGKIITEDNPRKVNFGGVIYREGTCTEGIFFDEFGSKSGVYVIRIQNTEKYKIGETKNLKRRIQQLSTGNPENIKIVYFIATKSYNSLEKHLHKNFSEFRIGGEWFKFGAK